MSISSDNFAVLSEHRRWRLVVFFMLYVAQGIPFGLIAVALPAYMAQRGVNALTISAFLGVCLLPHAIKLVNGPIMDRWTFRPMGKRRPWVLLAQVILVLTFASLALVPDPLSNIRLLTFVCFVINFFVGFQDVATDGMAVDLLPVEDQAKASSIMFGGAVVSVAITSTIGGWALSRYGIGVASVCCACVIILISGFLLISRERVGERLLPWTKGRAVIDPLVHAPETFKEIALDLGKFVLLRASLFAVAAAIIYQFGRGIFLAMMPIYYVQELGWTDVSYSGLTGTATFIGGTVSILFGGLLLDFLGRTRAFQILCVAAAALGVMLAVAPGLGDSDTVMKIYRVLYMTLDTLITVAFIAIAMAICARQVAATQFAIYMALSNVGYSAGSAAFGPLYESLASFEAVFLVFTGVVIAAAVTMRQVSIADHISTVRKLEADEK